MGQRALIDLNRLARDLNKISAKISKVEDIATVKTINIIADRARMMISRDVKDDTGVAIATSKRRIKIYPATPFNYQAALFMKDTRLTYPQPRQLKKGASFLSLGRKRKKVTTKIKAKGGGTGSRPFVARLPAGGTPEAETNKRAAVYVLPEYVNVKGSKKKGSGKPHPRKISAMYFSSLPHLARKDWQNKVSKFSMGEFAREYPTQLKKANRTGRF